MKPFIRAPLYLGVGIFVLSVIVSGITISDRNFQTRIISQAKSEKATLSFIYTPPSLLSVNVSAPKNIAGVDAAVVFDPYALEILGATLVAGPNFTTTSGFFEDNGVFSFSAITKPDVAITNGIVATFQILPKIKGDTTVSFETVRNNSLVFTTDSDKPISLESQDTTLKL